MSLHDIPSIYYGEMGDMGINEGERCPGGLLMEPSSGAGIPGDGAVTEE